MLDCLIDWWLNWLVVELIHVGLVDWLIDWLMDWWIDGLMDWWIDGLMDWWIDGLMDWLIDWLIDWWIGWLMDWLVDGLIGWLIDWLIVIIKSSHHTSWASWGCRWWSSQRALFHGLVYIMDHRHLQIHFDASHNRYCEWKQTATKLFEWAK